MQSCRFCGHELPDKSRFCIQCGRPVEDPFARGQETPHQAPLGRHMEELNLRILYIMVAFLMLAVVFPPWQTPPDHGTPEFLGFHFLLSPPQVGMNGDGPQGVISRLLWTIDLVTIAMAGFYLSWLFRNTS